MDSFVADNFSPDVVKDSFIPDDPIPRQSFLASVVNAGIEAGKDVPAQIQDLLNIPAMLIGTPRPAMQSRLATETVPYLLEKATAPIYMTIPSTTGRNIKSIFTGKGVKDTSEIEFSLLDIGWYLLMGASIVRNQLAFARWNTQINKLIKTEEVRGVVMKNMPSFEALMKQVGVNTEGMDLEAKTNFILYHAQTDPKLGSAIMDLTAGKIGPKTPLPSQPIETGVVSPATAPKQPVLAPKQPLQAPITPQVGQGPTLALKLNSGQIVSDTTAKMHSDIIASKGIKPEEVQDVGIVNQEGVYEGTHTLQGKPLETLPEVPKETIEKAKGLVAENPVDKMINAIKKAKDIRGKQETLYTKARAEKLAKMSAAGKKVGGQKGYYARLGALKGKLPKVEFESIVKELKQEDIDYLFDMVKASPHLSEWDKLSVFEGLENLLGQTGGRVPTPTQIKFLHKVFGKDFTDAVLDKRPLFDKMKEAGLQLANIPRSIMASFDLSFGLRQGSFLAPRYRKEFFDSFKKQFGWFKSEDVFKEAMKVVSENPNYELAVESGVAFTEMDSLMAEREEIFASQWAEKIPVIGKGIRASGRAYTAFANKLRMDSFDRLVQDAQNLGLNPQKDRDLSKAIAEFVNKATGRGSLGSFERAALGLNAFFFSPRLMASRLSLLNPIYYINQNPFVRKEALKSLLTFLGTGLAIVTLAKLMGAEVGIDPRSSDFGKIKIGDTRIDIWGGFQQYIRMAGQMISGKYVSSTTKKVLTLGEGYKPLTRLDILLRQIESKEAPVFSFITDLLKGQDFEGKPINIPKEIGMRFVPMVIQDLYDTIKENPEATPAVLLAPFGVGVQTYKSKKGRKF